MCPQRQLMISKMRDASQKPENERDGLNMEWKMGQSAPKASQKNIAPAFFILHHPGKDEADAYFFESERQAREFVVLSFVHDGYEEQEKGQEIITSLWLV